MAADVCWPCARYRATASDTVSTMDMVTSSAASATAPARKSTLLRMRRTRSRDALARAMACNRVAAASRRRRRMRRSLRRMRFSFLISADDSSWRDTRAHHRALVRGTIHQVGGRGGAERGYLVARGGSSEAILDSQAAGHVLMLPLPHPGRLQLLPEPAEPAAVTTPRTPSAAARFRLRRRRSPGPRRGACASAAGPAAGTR